MISKLSLKIFQASVLNQQIYFKFAIDQIKYSKAVWASKIHDQIVKLGSSQKAFKQIMRQMKVDEVKGYYIDVSNYMKGYFLQSQSEGPILQTEIFYQNRFTAATDQFQRIVFRPTNITKAMFNRINKNRITQMLISGPRGTGKSFGIMLYWYLNRHRTEAKVNFIQERQTVPKQIKQNKKLIYWSIRQYENSENIQEVIRQIYKKIIFQCEQIKKDIEVDMVQFQQILNKTDKFDQLSQRNANPQLLSYFKSFCQKIKQIYHDKYKLNTVLVIDQINTIASGYRQAKQYLTDHPNSNIFQNADYNKTQNIDMMRMSLQQIGRRVCLNSSINIEKEIVSTNYNEKIPMKIKFGSNHEPFKHQPIFPKDHYKSEKYIRQMKSVLQDALQQKINNLPQDNRKQKQKQIQQILQDFDNFKLKSCVCQLVIRETIQKLDQNNLNSFLQALQQQISNHYLFTFNIFFQKARRSLIMFLQNQKIKQTQLQKLTDQQLKKLKFVKFSQPIVMLYKINSQLERQQKADSNKQLKIEFNPIWPYDDLQKHIFQSVTNNQLFYFEKQRIKVQTNNQTDQKNPNLKLNKIQYEDKVYLKSFVPISFLSDIFNKLLKSSSNSKLTRILGDSIMIMQANLTDMSVIGKYFEYYIIQSLVSSDKIIFHINGHETKQFYKEKSSYYLFEAFKSSKSLKNITSVLEKVKIENNVSLLMLPTRFSKNQISSQAKTHLEMPVQDSKATDLIIATKREQKWELNFVEITLQKQDPIVKIINFLQLLWLIPQLSKKQFYKEEEGKNLEINFSVLCVGYETSTYNIVDICHLIKNKQQIQNSNFRKIVDRKESEFQNQKKKSIFSSQGQSVENNEQRYAIFIENIRNMVKKCNNVNFFNFFQVRLDEKQQQYCGALKYFILRNVTIAKEKKVVYQIY